MTARSLRARTSFALRPFSLHPTIADDHICMALLQILSQPNETQKWVHHDRLSGPVPQEYRKSDTGKRG